MDGAESYSTDPELGAAVQKSKVPRDQFFVTTKIWPKSSIHDISGTLDRCLKNLGLDYVDLFLIHDPFWANDDEQKLQSSWKEMESLQKSGKARAIGVSNYLRSHVEAVLKTAEIPPAVNQIEFHPYLQREGTLVPWLQSKNILVTAYGPLTPITRAAGKSPELEALLGRLAAQYRVSPGEVLLRWCIDQGVVPITTTSREGRMKDYLRVATFTLTPAEVQEIAKAGQGVHHRAFWSSRFNGDGDRR